MEMHMMFRRNTAKASEPSSSSRGKAVQITEITKMDDFIKFLGQDDRLCVVK
jgi:sulfur carrier protein ThiS